MRLCSSLEGKEGGGEVPRLGSVENITHGRRRAIRVETGAGDG